MQAISKITAKGQTTVPQEIRAALNSKAGDLIGDLGSAGLPAPSIVRFKRFTLDHRLVRGKLGRLDEKDRAKMQKAMGLLLP